MNHSRVGWADVARGALRTVPDFLRPHRRHQWRFSGLNRKTPQSIGRVIEYWAERTPERTALRFEARSWSYRELNAWINRVAGVLKARGLVAGQTVGLMMDNRPELLVALIATVKLGGIGGMLNPNQRGEVLAHSIRLVSPKFVLISAECLEALGTTDHTPQQTAEVEYLWHGGDTDAVAPAGWLDLAQACLTQSDANPTNTRLVLAGQPAYYVFTSGTTGLPKASVMSHMRWLSSSNGIGGRALRIRPDDVFYCCLPLYHNNALSISLGAALSAGACFALDRKFSASRFWDRLRHYQATSFCYIGELLRYLLNQPPNASDRQHPVRLIVGNGLRPEIWGAFEQRFGISRIYEFYGASEANIAFVNVFGLRQTAGYSPGSFAIVGFDNEHEKPLRNAAGYLQRVAVGEVGLLLAEVNRRQPFEGYTDAKATEQKLLRDVFVKGDCWFNTGDLVRHQGLRHIQFVDRVGDTFRWKGENVATGEVEGALAKLPQLEHGIVYGVPVPGYDGRAGMTALGLKPDTRFDGTALARDLCAQLPGYAVPLFVRILAEQQTTGTFKYRKVELKKEGFDLNKVADPVYVLLDRAAGYQPLTAALFQQLQSGALRL